MEHFEALLRSSTLSLSSVELCGALWRLFGAFSSSMKHFDARWSVLRLYYALLRFVSHCEALLRFPTLSYAL